MDINLCECIGRTALSMVHEERKLQIENGYDYAHDDQHGNEEIAAAAAYFLAPSWVNPDVCIFTEGCLQVVPLQQLISDAAWPDIVRDYDDPDVVLDMRIDNVVRGVAMGLAELERLLRMREANGGAA